MLAVSPCKMLFDPTNNDLSYLAVGLVAFLSLIKSVTVTGLGPTVSLIIQRNFSVTTAALTTELSESSERLTPISLGHQAAYSTCPTSALFWNKSFLLLQ